MTRLPMSPAASALLRALLQKSGGARDRILLTEIRSTDWQSLTFVGETHRLRLRITGREAAALASRLADGLGEEEFTIRGQIVADIHVTERIERPEDGSVDLSIEALTITE